jgi:hypothetical protein
MTSSDRAIASRSVSYNVVKSIPLPPLLPSKSRDHPIPLVQSQWRHRRRLCWMSRVMGDSLLAAAEPGPLSHLEWSSRGQVHLSEPRRIDADGPVRAHNARPRPLHLPGRERRTPCTPSGSSVTAVSSYGRNHMIGTMTAVATMPPATRSPDASRELAGTNRSRSQRTTTGTTMATHDLGPSRRGRWRCCMQRPVPSGPAL